MTWEGLSPPYSTIVVDPPWKYQKNPTPPPRGSRRNQAEMKYPTLTNEQIRDLPVRELAADAAHLYLWMTNPGIYGGRFSSVTPKDIAEVWGFEFQTVLTWVKTGAIGMGWYFRGATEHVLFATRGRSQTLVKNLSNVVSSARRGHSEKPPAFFDLVERASPGPYVELFARQPRLGWDHWGDGYVLTEESA